MKYANTLNIYILISPYRPGNGTITGIGTFTILNIIFSDFEV